MRRDSARRSQERKSRKEKYAHTSAKLADKRFSESGKWIQAVTFAASAEGK